MRKTQIVNVLQPIDQLLEVVASNGFLESACLRKHNKEVGLERREDKVRVRLLAERQLVRVETLDHIRVVHYAVDLFLVFGFVDFGLLSLVQLYEDLGSLRWLRL